MMTLFELSQHNGSIVLMPYKEVPRHLGTLGTLLKVRHLFRHPTRWDNGSLVLVTMALHTHTHTHKILLPRHHIVL